MPGNETLRPSKWWLCVLPPAVVLSYLFVVTFLGWWDSEWFLRSGVGRVAVLPMRPLYVWIGGNPHWGLRVGVPWDMLRVPAAVLVLASLLVGWTGYRLRFASHRTLLVVGVVMGIVVATGAAAHLGWRLWSRSIAPDALHEYRVMLRRFERQCRRRKWEYLWSGGALEYPKDQYWELSLILSDSLSARMDTCSNEAWLAFFGARSKRPEWFTGIEVEMHGELFRRLLPGGDREALVDLLSFYCPVWEGPHQPTFDWLLVKYYGDGLEDPILLLCDAYERAERPDVKENCQFLLARAFPMVPREGDGDAFVQACREWYLKHKDRLVLNPDYKDDWEPGTPLFLLLEPQETK